MNLRSVLFLIGFIALCVQILCFFVFSQKIITPNIITLEKTLVVKNLHRGLELIQRELVQLERLTQILAQFPMLQQLLNYSPVKPTAPNSVLQEKMTQLELNVLYILDNNQDVIWEKIIDLNTNQPYPKQPFLTNLWEQSPQFLSHSSLLSLQAGIFDSVLGPMLLVSAPIPTKDNKQVQGTVLIGKLLTQDMMQLLQSLTYTDIQLWPLAGSPLNENQTRIIQHLLQSDSDFRIEQSGNRLLGYMFLRDLDEKPNLLISTTLSLDFLKSINLNLIELAAVLFTIFCIFFLTLYLWIHFTILNPMDKLSEKINNSPEEWALESPSTSKNELDLLANTLSSFMVRLQAQHVQAINHAYQEGFTTARQLLHLEVMDKLSPLIEKSEVGEKKLSNLAILEIEQMIAECKARQNLSEHCLEYIHTLQGINEKLRLFQKETRNFYELNIKTLRSINAVPLRSLIGISLKKFNHNSSFVTKKSLRRPGS